MQERISTPDYTIEKYVDVVSLNEQNNLRRRAVRHTFGRSMTPEDFFTLNKIRDQIAQHKKPDFDLLGFKLRVNIGYGPFVEEIYGEPGKGHTFLHLGLYNRTVEITYWNAPEE